MHDVDRQASASIAEYEDHAPTIDTVHWDRQS
jgi:hypothetical protein